ncbi:CBO0543 family protein [Dendrosporobacter sp. 1207_IL3150]|uniref:CBO0543 family protein n=1 Tax=Dendrosporobacter sp. 1207_IL3150 TaxID=3084054 RepID=UPI002FDB5888
MLHLFFSVLIFNLIAYSIPKNLTKDELYSTCLFAIVIQSFVDVFLDLKYDLYGYFNPGVDALTMIPILGIYPALNIIFLNYYPFSGTTVNKLFYALKWCIFSIAFEWSTIYAGWFYHNGWKLWYSFIFYIPMYFTIAKNLELLRRLKRQN